MSDQLRAGQVLGAGDRLVSARGLWRLEMHDDGELVLIRPDGSVAWTSNTRGHWGSRAMLTEDGEFLIRTPEGGRVWSSGRTGRRGTTLRLGDDGQLRLDGPDGRQLWSAIHSAPTTADPGWIDNTESAFPEVRRRYGRYMLEPDMQGVSKGAGEHEAWWREIAELDSPATPARYANVLLREPGGRIMTSRSAIHPRARLTMDVALGPVEASGAVFAGDEFPDWALPPGAVIEVLVASTDFLVGPEGHQARRRLSRRQLPPAPSTPSQRQRVRFSLTAPVRPGRSRVRITFYFRNAVLQSLRLDVNVGNEPSAATLAVDFTTTLDFRHIAAISDRPRLSFVLNDVDSGNHQVVLRAPGAKREGPSKASVFELPPQALDDNLAALRSLLSSEAVAPTKLKRGRDQLINDLRSLAPIGWSLFSAFRARAGRQFRDQRDYVVQICRSTSSTLTMPWNFLYDIFLDSQYLEQPQKLSLCPLIGDWDGRSALIDRSYRECPRHPLGAENLLCPFGFWGFRRPIEVLASTDEPQLAIKVPPSSRLATAETALVDPAKLTSHVMALESTFKALVPNGAVVRTATKRELRKEIELDLPFIYFLCHGYGGKGGTYLAIGNDERITPQDLTGWMEARAANRNAPMWDDPRPFIFINACRSLQVTGRDLLTYLDVMLGLGGAAGVIGTEAKVNPELAMRFGELVFTKLLAQPAGVTVDEAMHAARTEFLASGNVFGLLYTQYCWADLGVQLT